MFKNSRLEKMKGTRETSFISSATISESPEYKLIVRHTLELRTAIQDNLQDISDHLLSCGMITQDSHEDFTNCYKPTHTRAASLIRAVQNKIKSDHHYYSKFIEILEKNEQYYNSILQKLHSHNIDSQPMYSQHNHNVCEDIDGLSESDETGALLRVPYIQYENVSQCHEPERQYSNTVHACYSYCMDGISYFMEFAADRPLKTILVQLVIGFLLLIIIVQLIIKATSVYNFLLALMLFFAFFFN